MDLINNMDHMRISGTEPSSVILSETKSDSLVLCKLCKSLTINISRLGIISSTDSALTGDSNLGVFSSRIMFGL